MYDTLLLQGTISTRALQLNPSTLSTSACLFFSLCVYFAGGGTSHDLVSSESK